MRIAWIGTPAAGGGVGGMCRHFLKELGNMPGELDVYANAEISDVPELLDTFDGDRKRFLPFRYHWDWNAWYGRNRRTAFVVSFLKRLPLHGQMVIALIAEHRRQPYDVVIQFSQGELLSLKRHAGKLPIVLFPCVHAAGELHWCRKEDAISRRCERGWWRVLRNGYLAHRARLQKRDYRLARGVIGMSHRFNRWVQRDYRVPSERLGVVYHPIEVGGPSDQRPTTPRPIRLLFVGRVSVRKGVELLVQVIPSVLAAHPDVEVGVIGAGSLWSDYETLLSDLPKERCRWLRSLPNDQVAAEMLDSDILLVPSWYEPGGIVVGEALANGMIVVASDEVGSAENLPPSVCKEFHAGDLEGFRSAIDLAIGAVRTRGPELRQEAAAVAGREFDPGRMAEQLLSEVKRLLKK